MRADRLLSILLLLQTRGRIPARELARRLEVSERTIYRDLDALGVAGVPVCVERGCHGGCALVDGYRTDLTGLTDAEVRTLFATRTAGHLADLGLGAVGEAALVKLLAALPTTSHADAERALARIHLDPDPWFQDAEAAPYLPLLHKAVWQERRLQLTYRRGNDAITIGVAEPLGLVAKARTWYLVAREAGATRVFRVARIQEARLLDEPVARPEGFELRAFWDDWRAEFVARIPRYPVIVRVAPAAMDRLGRLLGAEVIVDLARATPPDGAGWRTVPVTFERAEDARRALLGCGPLVEAVEPLELRQRIADAATGLVALYNRDDPTILCCPPIAPPLPRAGEGAGG